MKEPQRNFLTDVVALALFLGLVTTGIVLGFLLPPRSGNLGLWGLTRHEWGDIHFWMAIGFLVVIGIHLLLHARWIMAMIRGRISASSRMRVTVSIVLLGLALTVAAGVLLGPRSPVDGAGQRHGQEHRWEGGHQQTP